MSKVHIDLSEELEEVVKNLFNQVCDDVSSKLEKLNSDVTDICTQTSYEPFVKYANSVNEQLKGDVKNRSNKILDEWKEKASFKQRALRAKAGESAIEIAEQIETNIQNRFDEFWTLSFIGDGIKVDTSHPKLQSEDFETFKLYYKTASDGIEEISKNVTDKVKTLAEDNPSYEHIIAPIRSITDVIKNNLEKISNKIKDFQDKSEEISKRQSKIDKEMAQGAVTSAKQVAEFENMFNDADMIN